jgi:hypothetical protein
MPNTSRAYQGDRPHHPVASTLLDEFNLLFSGRKNKTALSAEEIADFKLKDSKASQVRSALPTILKLWSPLPQQNIIKHGHIAKLLTALANSPIASHSETLLQGVKALIDNPKPNELHHAEADFLNVLSDIRASLMESPLTASILLNALSPGQLRDACMAYMFQQGRFNDVRQAVAQELRTVQNPALRASLEATVRHSPEFVAIHQSVDERGKYQTESRNPLLQHLASASAESTKVHDVLSKLYSSQSDDTKREIILSNVHEGRLRFVYKVVVPILAGLGTFQDPKKRSALIEDLQKKPPYHLSEGLCLVNQIQAPEKIAMLDKATALPSLAAEGLKPFVERGFSILDVPKLISLLEMTGRDASVLITTILPAYDEVLDFTLKHPDRLVKTGNKPPSEAQIRARFHQQGMLIMRALILTGVPTLKSTIHRKRLDNLLQMMPTVTSCFDLFKPAHQLSKMTEEPVDNYRLVEFITSFSEIHKEKELKFLLDKMVQNKKLDIKAIGKMYLAAVFDDTVLKGAHISDDQIDKWDIKHMSTLASALRSWQGDRRGELIALCKAAMQGRFHTYLHDPGTQIGKNNLATQKAFEEIGLDYQQWLHYSGKVVFRHLSKGDEKQAITQAVNNLFLEIQTQHATFWPPIEAELLRQQLPVSQGQLQSLPPRRLDEIRLKQTLKNELLFQEPSIKQRADSLCHRIDNLESAPAQTQQLKIKLWERNPGTDLFLGNYTGACIALDSYGSNSYAVVQAIQNSFVQIACLYDEANKVVGKGLFYWAKNTQTGEPVLILNTFEGRAAKDSGYEHNIQIRDKYIEFTKQYSRAVLGYVPPMYTGTELNPLYRSDLKESPIDIHVVGSALHNNFYLDSLPDDGKNIDLHHKPNYRLQLLYAGEPGP